MDDFDLFFADEAADGEGGADVVDENAGFKQALEHSGLKRREFDLDAFGAGLFCEGAFAVYHEDRFERFTVEVLHQVVEAVFAAAHTGVQTYEEDFFHVL